MTDDGLGTAGSMLDGLINRVEKEEPGLREGELRHFIAAFAETDDFSTRFELVKGTTLYRSGDPEKAALDERILLKILSELDDDRDIKLDFTLASLECHQPDKMLYPGLWAFFEEVARDHWGVFLRYLHRIGTDESNDFFRKDAFYRKPEFTGFLKLLVKAFPEGRDELEDLFLWNDILTEIYNVVIFSTDPAPDPMEEKERIKNIESLFDVLYREKFSREFGLALRTYYCAYGKGHSRRDIEEPAAVIKNLPGYSFPDVVRWVLRKLADDPEYDNYENVGNFLETCCPFIYDLESDEFVLAMKPAIDISALVGFFCLRWKDILADQVFRALCPPVDSLNSALFRVWYLSSLDDASKNPILAINDVTRTMKKYNERIVDHIRKDVPGELRRVKRLLEEGKLTEDEVKRAMPYLQMAAEKREQEMKTPPAAEDD